jgi:hypothetical protein
MASKAKKPRPTHIGRPAYQPHEPGKWNSFDTYLSRRTVRVGFKFNFEDRSPFRNQPYPYRPSYLFDARPGTKKDIRGAGPVKRVKRIVTRKYSKGRIEGACLRTIERTVDEIVKWTNHGDGENVTNEIGDLSNRSNASHATSIGGAMCLRLKQEVPQMEISNIRSNVCLVKSREEDIKVEEKIISPLGLKGPSQELLSQRDLSKWLLKDNDEYEWVEVDDDEFCFVENEKEIVETKDEWDMV